MTLWTMTYRTNVTANVKFLEETERWTTTGNLQIKECGYLKIGFAAFFFVFVKCGRKQQLNSFDNFRVFNQKFERYAKTDMLKLLSK